MNVHDARRAVVAFHKQMNSSDETLRIYKLLKRKIELAAGHGEVYVQLPEIVLEEGGKQMDWEFASYLLRLEGFDVRAMYWCGDDRLVDVMISWGVE